MENKLSITTNNQLSIIGELALAQKSKKINECSDLEIKEAILELLSLIGCPFSSYPQEKAKILLITFLKKRFYSLAVDELKLAFEYCIAEKFKAEINLFGEFFSPKYLSQVLNSYIRWKNNLPKPKEERMTCSQRFFLIVKNLKKKHPETSEVINQFGNIKTDVDEKQKEINQKSRKLWFNQFHNLEKKCGAVGTIVRYGKIMDVISYCQYKEQQQERVKLLLKNRNKTTK